MVPRNQEMALGKIRIRGHCPLKPGRYEFVGEYHSKTAHGAIVVR